MMINRALQLVQLHLERNTEFVLIVYGVALHQLFHRQLAVRCGVYGWATSPKAVCVKMYIMERIQFPNHTTAFSPGIELPDKC